jgi:hypothetical protein
MNWWRITACNPNNGGDSTADGAMKPIFGLYKDMNKVASCVKIGASYFFDEWKASLQNSRLHTPSAPQGVLALLVTC